MGDKLPRCARDLTDVKKPGCAWSKASADKLSQAMLHNGMKTSRMRITLHETLLEPSLAWRQHSTSRDSDLCPSMMLRNKSLHEWQHQLAHR
eukprot:2680738-Amphidinium_carterae.1